MDKEIRNIFENYQETWSLSPKESFKRDKEFFQYVIESNPHLAPLREFKLKYIFELYKAKLRQELDLDAPGLVNESYNISNEDAFNVLEEMTRNVSDQEAYNNVKRIFESVCADVLLYKGDVLLEVYRDTATAVARGNYDAKRAAAGAPGAAKPTRKRDYAAEYARRKELEAQRAQAADQPGETVTDTVTTDTEVAIPASRNVAQPNAAQIQQQKQIRDQESQIKNLQAQQGQPTAAQIKQQQQIRDMEAQLKASQQTIADLEEKEKADKAAGAEQRKADSDKRQAELTAQNDKLMAVLQQMGRQSTQTSQQAAQTSQQAAQNAAVDDDLAARMQQTAGRGPQAAPAAVPPVIDKETQTTSDTVYGGEKAPKKTGLLTRLGSFGKNILPTAGAIGGAALGSALGPAGMVAGGALGKALGKGAKGFADAPKGTGIGGRLKRAGKTHVSGSDLASGAAIGGLGAAGLGGGGEEVVDTAVDTETIDTTTPTTTPPGMVGDTADVNSPEYQATMSQYADTQPALMNRDGSMGPGVEPTMGDGTQRTDADVAGAIRDRYGNLMQRNEYGGLGDTDISGTVPEVEDEVTSTDVEVEEAPYGRNPNTGEPLPEPPKGKGGSRLMQLANKINPYAR